MKKVKATISLFDEKLGGRKSPLVPVRFFGCPLFFKNIAELSSHGYDCRILVNEYGKEINPGDTIHDLDILFLSSDEVFKYIKIGTEFYLWEGGYIGTGIITRIDT